MGHAAHLGIKLADYDRAIRTFIPRYTDMLDAAAAALAVHVGRAPTVVDLGTGSGALAARVLRAVPSARVIGVDEDEGMLGLAQTRLRGRLTPLVGNFLSTPVPRCHAITASFALHHVRVRRRKAALYARCFRALRPGGVLVNADCCLASNARMQAHDRAAWRDHLAATYGRSRAEGYLRAWAKEDFYFTLDDETAMLKAAGFGVDVPWRHDSFAVVVATRR